MRTSYRVVSAALIAGLILSACGGRGSTPPLAGAQANSVVSAPESVANAQVGAVPHPSGELAVNDLGRRAASAPVHVSITLAYNHQAQLDALVKAQADPTSPMYHQFLTTDQFNAYYAPTVQQEASVVDSLRAAGFTVTQRFANRTIIDATAPSSTVEKYFSTEIHNVSQGKFGTRYMNARNPVVPSPIASLVRDVSLNNIIVAKTRANPHRSINVTTTKQQQKGSNHDVRSASRVVAATCTGQLLLNPGFESGTAYWNDPNGDIYNYAPYAYQGNYFAWIDGYSSPVTDPGVSQTVNIPAGCTATLSYYLFVGSNEPATPTDYFYVTVNGHTVQTYNNTTNTGGTYAHTSVNVSAYAGQSATIKFYAVQNGYNTTNFFVDNTALTLSGGTSTPTPSPVPTATPTPKPTPSPTPVPTATPAPTPTPVPTSTPTPTPVATATPTPSSNCNGASALNGPLSGSYGHFPTGVAKAFDFPTQHGCTGAGQTIAIMIDTPIVASDVSTFLSSAGITQTGSITNVAVDGGGTTATSDYTETALDVETVSGLAPAANIRVYNFPNLTDQSIEDGYNQAVSDGIASVVNSSFGGCESGDTPFANTTNSIAQQAAAKGMTFMASSGDSGSNECSGTQGVSAPAGGPYFVSVGAVNFTQNSTTGALSTITAGSDSANGFQSGGGVSTVFALPSYQSGVANVITSGRNQPDISLPGVGVALYAASQGGWMTVDGTSWSSPEVTALIAETNQLHATKFGWVTPTLYSIFKSSSYTDFTDVTSGTNGGYNAVAGYDQVTGIGAPKGWALAQAI